MQTPPFFDRETSEMEYHARVLARAADRSLPLLERAKFLAIFTTLTDEFFRVRVAGLKAQRAAGVESLSRGGLTPTQLIDGLYERFRELLAEQRGIFDRELVPSLGKEGILLRTWADLDEAGRKQLSVDFRRRISPVLIPLAVGPAHPFPFISDLSLSVGVTLTDQRGPGFGRIKVPKMLGRFVQVDGDDGPVTVPLEEVIGAHAERLFPGRQVAGWHTFRVTRNADFDVEDIDVADLLHAVASELLGRRFGHAVRLEVDTEIPEVAQQLLVRELDLDEDAVFVQPRPLDLNSLWELYALDRPDLKHPPWDPVCVPEFTKASPFQALRNADVLVHHPYDSFTATAQRFIEQAADDPDVLALKQTLYRTSEDSPIVRALIRAAESGKQVAALVELKARFDEEANIRWAEQLESAGVHVVFGFIDLKTHSKTALVVRQDPDGEIRRYGHIGTGNYNPRTAKSYEDLGLFTADSALTEDLAELFNMLTTNGRQGSFQRLLVAPVDLKPRLLKLIEGQAHEDGRIVIKVNNLSHEEMIRGLYRASQNGAEIDLVVRSICCLRPGIEGLSERIRVRSIVGPFLEHSRIFRFGDPGDEATYLLGSADLMSRNLENRIEAVIPVDDPTLRSRLDVILDLCLQDTELAWGLGSDGAWRRIQPDGDRVEVQQALKDLARRRADAADCARGLGGPKTSPRLMG
ncbi:MAG: polyphosphate kinase 1 [Egibacteraceae bacterium]